MSLASFRSFANQQYSFDQIWTGFYGPNSSGKTNILEAIHVLFRLRGFRNEPIARLASWDSDRGSLFAKLASRTLPTVDREISWDATGVTLREDGDRIDNRRSWVTRWALFGYRPDDDLFFHEEPKHRRRYLDWLCSYIDPLYMDAAGRYSHTLKQRNAALRNPTVSSREFDVWERELAETGAALTAARERTAQRLRRQYLSLVVETGLPSVALSYNRGGSDSVELAQKRLREGRISDRKRGWTGWGPHRDDLTVHLQGRPIRESGSQGQRKLAVILLAVACTLVADPTEETKPFYLDDIEGELDAENERRLFEVLRQLPLQVFLTAVRKVPALEDYPLQWYHLGETP